MDNLPEIQRTLDRISRRLGPVIRRASLIESLTNRPLLIVDGQIVVCHPLIHHEVSKYLENLVNEELNRGQPS